MAFIWSPLAATATRNLPAQLAGAGSGVYNTTRQVGSVLGSAGMAAFMASRLSAEMPGAADAAPQSEGSVTQLPGFLHAPFAAAMSQAMLLPAFVALLGVVAALFLLGFANAPLAAPASRRRAATTPATITTGMTGISSTTTSTSSTSCTGTTPNRGRPRLRGCSAGRRRHRRPGRCAGTREAVSGMAQHPRSADGGTDVAPGVERVPAQRVTCRRPRHRQPSAPRARSPRQALAGPGRIQSSASMNAASRSLVLFSATVSAPIAFSRTRGLSGKRGNRSRNTLRRDDFSQSNSSACCTQRI